MKINKVFNNVLYYWKPTTLLISVFGSLILYISTYFFPNIKFDSHWVITFIYLGLISLVLVLLEIRTSLIGKKESNHFSNMNSASDDIIQTIKTASGKNKNSPVEVKIVGNRLSRISPMLSDVFRMVKESKLKRKINITVYHIDPKVVDDLYFHRNEDRDEISS